MRNGERLDLGDLRRRSKAMLWVALTAFSAARAEPPAALDAIVQFHTVCNSCHEGECSGRLSFDSGSAAARGHIERYLGATPDASIASLFAMLRHVKESCSHYPAVPLRPAVGTWQAKELAPTPQAEQWRGRTICGNAHRRGVDQVTGGALCAWGCPDQVVTPAKAEVQSSSYPWSQFGVSEAL
jgi:hypothetical protein